MRSVSNSKFIVAWSEDSDRVSVTFQNHEQPTFTLTANEMRFLAITIEEVFQLAEMSSPGDKREANIRYGREDSHGVVRNLDVYDGERP